MSYNAAVMSKDKRIIIEISNEARDLFTAMASIKGMGRIEFMDWLATEAEKTFFPGLAEVRKQANQTARPGTTERAKE